jgi:hypothetical protein
MKMLERAKNLRNNMQIVDLEGMVPQDHLLRKIDRVVDFNRVCKINCASALSEYKMKRKGRNTYGEEETGLPSRDQAIHQR